MCQVSFCFLSSLFLVFNLFCFNLNKGDHNDVSIICDEPYECDGQELSCGYDSNCHVECSGSYSCRGSQISGINSESFYLTLDYGTQANGPDIINVSSLITSHNDVLEYQDPTSPEFPRVEILCNKQFSCQGSDIIGNNIDSMKLVGGGAKSFRYANTELSNVCWVDLFYYHGDGNRCWNTVWSFSNVGVINMNDKMWDCFCNINLRMSKLELDSTVITVDGVIKTVDDITSCSTSQGGKVDIFNYNPNNYINNGDINIDRIYNDCPLVQELITAAPTSSPTLEPTVSVYNVETSDNNNYFGVFRFDGNLVSRNEAVKYCLNKFGTTLGSIHNNDENLEARNVLISASNGKFLNSKLGWIGLNDYDDKCFEWDDQSPVSFLNFAQNTFEDYQKCVAIDVDNGKWHDITWCKDTYPNYRGGTKSFICNAQ